VEVLRTSTNNYFKIIFQLDPITKKPVKSIERQERLVKLRVNITLEKGLFLIRL